jgi:putative toxin-antitoxin system antitoxin component (TIGR02293 family)
MARELDALLLSKVDGFANLELPSGEIRRVSLDCMATVGRLRGADDKRHSSSQKDWATAYFAQVYPRAVEVIGNADQAMRWLGRPIPALNYATPISLLRSESGRDAILDVLGRLEHGIF